MSQLPETSHIANREMTKEIREQHHTLILKSIEELGEAIYEVIALHCGMDRHQVGRRLKELVDAGKIYNTLKTGLTSKGRKAHMYAIRSETTIIPQPERFNPDEKNVADYANVLIASTAAGKKLFQTEMFNDKK